MRDWDEGYVIHIQKGLEKCYSSAQVSGPQTPGCKSFGPKTGSSPGLPVDFQMAAPDFHPLRVRFSGLQPINSLKAQNWGNYVQNWIRQPRK